LEKYSESFSSVAKRDAMRKMVLTPLIAKSQTRNKNDKDTPKGGILYSERRSAPPGFYMGRGMSRCPGKRKSPPASHQATATPIKIFLICQIHPSSKCGLVAVAPKS
jgi:hypothetical protein